MCGIVAYIGSQNPLPFLLHGLRKLEYRGYDSAGIAYLKQDSSIQIYKTMGKIATLQALINKQKIAEPLPIGIGHTRWATHGPPNTQNAHPHMGASKRLAIIHNGIIENYNVLKKQLPSGGYHFQSDTDTEVLLALIETIWLQKEDGKPSMPLKRAVQIALRKVVGAYALVIMPISEPRYLIAASQGSPLVLGLLNTEGDYYLASDATPIMEYTDRVIYLKEGDLACIQNGNITIGNLQSDIPRIPTVKKLTLNLNSVEKGNYAHFMLKEIHTQPEVLADCMRDRINLAQGSLHLSSLRDHMHTLVQAKRIIIIGCGTSWHAGLIGEYFIEELCRIPVEVEYASEFRYRNPVISPEDVILAISQSGETADTLAAIEIIRQKKATLIGVVNAANSSIVRKTDASVYLHAGPEIGVASTKAFTTQVTTLLMIAVQIGQARKSITDNVCQQIMKGLAYIPEQLRQFLKNTDHIQHIASLFEDKHNFIYLGRGVHFPVALEGALKLKEISYIHAEGYPAAEMKHGPIALIDENMPVVFLATQDASYEKIISNIQEVKSRKGVVIAIVTEKEQQIKEMADYTIEIPQADPLLMPILSVVPLQLLAYYIAVARGCNVDQPRNLAKSVTVE